MSTDLAMIGQVLSVEQLYTTYSPALYRYILSLVHSPEQAEDLTQETFLKATRALYQVHEPSGVRSWLYRIATNTVYDALRHQRLIRWEPLEEVEEADLASNDVQETCATRALVREALVLLPAHYRTALLLHLEQDCSYGEIAQRMGIAPGGVKMCLWRARQAFKHTYLALVSEDMDLITQP